MLLACGPLSACGVLGANGRLLATFTLIAYRVLLAGGNGWLGGGGWLLATTVTTMRSPRAERALERYAPHVRAGLLFRLRVLPGIGAALFGFAIALPTFIGIWLRIDSGIVHRHQSAVAFIVVPGLPASS